MAEEAEDAFDKLKAGAKAVAKKVTDPGKDLNEEYNKEKGRETARDFGKTDTSGSKDPMSPEKIISHDNLSHTAKYLKKKLLNSKLIEVNY